MREWDEWLAEGDQAGAPETGREYHWTTGSRLAAKIQPGDRFYVVAHGRLRGWAPVVRVDDHWGHDRSRDIIRAGGAVAVTIPQPVRGFRGLRRRWWRRRDEVPFPDWKDPAGAP